MESSRKQSSELQREAYEELFSTNELKAKAFDEIAEQYYFGNFGTIQKTTLDTLIFSIYMERLLDKYGNDFENYSSYKMSKLLGLTENRVDSLKEKKQLMFPHEFDWEESFLKICQNADYVDNYIYLYVSDKNLYKEIKNAVQEDGGYTNGSYTSNLMILPVKFFIPLLIKVSDEKNVKGLLESVKAESPTLKVFIEDKYEKKIRTDYTWRNVLADISEDTAVAILSRISPVAGTALESAIKNIRRKIEIDRNSKDKNK